MSLAHVYDLMAGMEFRAKLLRREADAKHVHADAIDAERMALEQALRKPEAAPATDAARKQAQSVLAVTDP